MSLPQSSRRQDRSRTCAAARDEREHAHGYQNHRMGDCGLRACRGSAVGHQLPNASADCSARANRECRRAARTRRFGSGRRLQSLRSSSVLYLLTLGRRETHRQERVLPLPFALRQRWAPRSANHAPAGPSAHGRALSNGWSSSAAVAISLAPTQGEAHASR
jgi:hypothetical protein